MTQRNLPLAQPDSSPLQDILQDKWISYLRVSTGRQGRSGLGLEAQRAAVESFLNGRNWKLVKEFVEVESGKNDDRPVLAQALKACRLYGAKLVIAKLDRLSRDAHFLLGLSKAGVDFVAADMPNANTLTVGIMAMVAQEERRMISERTKAALAAAKRRGVQLGGDRGVAMTTKTRKAGQEANRARAAARAADIAPIIADLQAAGATSFASHCRWSERPQHPDSAWRLVVSHAGDARPGAHLKVVPPPLNLTVDRALRWFRARHRLPKWHREVEA